MKSLILTFLLSSLSGCANLENSQPDPFPLNSELYSWGCSDYEDYSEVGVSTETCDEDIVYIVAELQFETGKIWKTNLKKETANSCDWKERFVFYDEYCIQVEGVALTAYAY